jgi:HD-GYP domain-containing protein (c-di-GMP phosphodiesterase class II)
MSTKHQHSREAAEGSAPARHDEYLQLAPSPGAEASLDIRARCDQATLGHMERTGDIAARLAPRLGLPEGRVERLRRAAKLHDVGKASIDPAILSKPGTLDPDEFAEVRRHTVIGHRLLATSGADLAWLSALIALTHHERFDGSGYPRGLSAEEIPIESRIVAVADVLDALLSDRPYRRALSAPEALAILAAGRGTHFDPKVADAALEDPRPMIAAVAAGRPTFARPGLVGAGTQGPTVSPAPS